MTQEQWCALTVPQQFNYMKLLEATIANYMRQLDEQPPILQIYGLTPEPFEFTVEQLEADPIPHEPPDAEHRRQVAELNRVMSEEQALIGTAARSPVDGNAIVQIVKEAGQQIADAMAEIVAHLNETG